MTNSDLKKFDDNKEYIDILKIFYKNFNKTKGTPVFDMLAEETILNIPDTIEGFDNFDFASLGLYELKYMHDYLHDRLSEERQLEYKNIILNIKKKWPEL